MNVAYELYKRAERDIEGITGDVWRKQQPDVIQALTSIYEEQGIDELIKVLNGVVEYSKKYVEPYVSCDVLMKAASLSCPPVPHITSMED